MSLYICLKHSVASHSLGKQSIQIPKLSFRSCLPLLSMALHILTKLDGYWPLPILLPRSEMSCWFTISAPNATSSMKRRLHLWLGVTLSVFNFLWHIECCSLLDQIDWFYNIVMNSVTYLWSKFSGCICENNDWANNYWWIWSGWMKLHEDGSN